MASVLLSAFTVCMSVISFLILGDQRCFPVESESHIGWTSSERAERLYALRLPMCTVDGTTHDHVTRRDVRNTDSTLGQRKKFYPPPLCFRLSQQLQVFTLSLDDHHDVFTLPVASRNYYSSWRETVLDLTLEGYNTFRE